MTTMPSWYTNRQTAVALAQLQELVADDMTVCDNCTYNADGLCLVGYSKPSRCTYYRPTCPDCKRPMTDYGRGFECEPCEYARSPEPADSHYYKSP